MYGVLVCCPFVSLKSGFWGRHKQRIEVCVCMSEWSWMGNVLNLVDDTAGNVTNLQHAIGKVS
jgi:hypothetical protein